MFTTCLFKHSIKLLQYLLKCFILIFQSRLLQALVNVKEATPSVHFFLFILLQIMSVRLYYYTLSLFLASANACSPFPTAAIASASCHLWPFDFPHSFHPWPFLFPHSTPERTAGSVHLIVVYPAAVLPALRISRQLWRILFAVETVGEQQLKTCDVMLKKEYRLQ